MDTTRAFARGMASRGNPMKVFDWDTAAKRIRGETCENPGDIIFFAPEGPPKKEPEETKED